MLSQRVQRVRVFMQLSPLKPAEADEFEPGIDISGAASLGIKGDFQVALRLASQND